MVPPPFSHTDEAADVVVPLLDLEPIHQPLFTELQAVLTRVLQSNRFVGGQELLLFEQELAHYCGVEHAIGVSSGTDALLASLMAFDIGWGDEVIVPTFTFFATAGSVRRVGAIPVFCDIEPHGLNMDPTCLEPLITDRTKAIIPVHLFGQAAEMTPILEVAARHGLRVIEDMAQAIGACYKGRSVGSFGDTACLSFFPSKNLGAMGDAGAVLTCDSELAERLRLLREHGAKARYYHAFVGGNFRLDAIQAAFLRVKLPYLPSWHEQRRRNAAAYHEGFRELEEQGLVILPRQLPNRRHVFNQYVIRVKDRDALQDYLSSHQVGTAVYYPVPLHLQECFGDPSAPPPHLPVAEEAAKEVLALPIFPGLSEAQQYKVIRCVSEFLLQRV